MFSNSSKTIYEWKKNLAKLNEFKHINIKAKRTDPGRAPFLQQYQDDLLKFFLSSERKEWGLLPKW